jgi:hypothetical protein
MEGHLSNVLGVKGSISHTRRIEPGDSHGRRRGVMLREAYASDGHLLQLEMHPAPESMNKQPLPRAAAAAYILSSVFVKLPIEWYALGVIRLIYCARRQFHANY